MEAVLSEVRSVAEAALGLEVTDRGEGMSGGRSGDEGTSGGRSGDEGTSGGRSGDEDTSGGRQSSSGGQGV